MGAPSALTGNGATSPAPLVIQAEVRDGAQSGDDIVLGSDFGDYIGSDYVVVTAWLPADLGADNTATAAPAAGVIERLRAAWTAQIQPRLRWALYRKGGTPPATERVILWAPPEAQP